MIRSCWCSAPSLGPFTHEYLVCTHCGTLVSQFAHDRNVARVSTDESDLYGKNYWFGHMEQDLGLTNIYQRARADLGERCLYWLRTLLNYRTPPATVLELGSAHGGFVALLSWAGFDASGLELSPTIAQIARDLYGVTMLVGPIEDQQIDDHSLDVIAMMDVLEHLPDPVATIRRCAQLLKPGGVMLIQTPQFPEGHTFEALDAARNPFLDMLKPEEHLYLFSERSARQLFEQAGLSHVVFERALFSHYDMFFLVSNAPISRVDVSTLDDALLKTPDGRVVRALLDLQGRLDESVPRAVFDASEEDRAARLRVIEDQGRQLGEAAAREEAILDDIDGLRAALAALDPRGAEAHTVAPRRVPLVTELEALRRAFEASEQDREARLRVIERQGAELGVAGQRVQALTSELEQLRHAYTLCDEERSGNRQMLEQHERVLHTVQERVTGLQDEIERVRASHDSAVTARADALSVIERQNAQMNALAAALDESRATIEQSRKEVTRLANRGVLQLIFDRLRLRN